MVKKICLFALMVVVMGSLSGCDFLWFGAGAGTGYYVGSHNN